MALFSGGGIEFAKLGSTGLSRRAALKAGMENYGWDRSTANRAYANAINALRAQGLHGRELRQSARRMIANNPNVTQTNGYNVESVKPVVNPSLTVSTGTSPEISALRDVARNNIRTVTSNLAQSNIDRSNFNTAFRNARVLGLKQFTWRGNKYGTALSPLWRTKIADPTDEELFENVELDFPEPYELDDITLINGTPYVTSHLMGYRTPISVAEKNLEYTE